MKNRRKEGEEYAEKLITKSYNEQEKRKEGNQRNVNTKMLGKQVGVNFFLYGL